MECNFYEEYNSIMYNERDAIADFLGKLGKIRYSRQCGSWHFEKPIEVIAHQGSVVQITDIKLDKDKVVVFIVNAFMENGVEWECTDFAYGQLSKVIEVLPDIDTIICKNAYNDLLWAHENYNIKSLLREFHFELAPVKNYDCDGEKLVIEDNGRKIPLIQSEIVQSFRDHIISSILRCSPEYNDLMDILSLQENLRFEFSGYGEVTFQLRDSDIEFDVLSVSRDDKGNLTICGNDIKADISDNVILTEKDIYPEYLDGITAKIAMQNSIMDVYNAHDKELVRKINLAWTQSKYHFMFADILYALAKRDAQEIKDNYNCVIDSPETAMCEAHLILEHVCDDWDLETILSFIRYTEEETNG